MVINTINSTDFSSYPLYQENPIYDSDSFFWFCYIVIISVHSIPTYLHYNLINLM